MALLLTRHGIAVTGNAKGELRDLLAAHAHAGPTRSVFFRVAVGADPQKREAFVNLMSPDAMGVRINSNGWTIERTETFPVTFANRMGGLPMQVPVRANDGVGFLDRLGRHIVLHQIVRPNDPDDAGIRQRAGLLLFTLNQFYRAGSAVHLALTGPQGSGKTFGGKRLKALVDPDAVPVVLSLPAGESTLFAFAREQPLLVLDNLSSMRGDAADAFCALATGGGAQSRKLYTNHDRAMTSAQSSLVFTSIREDIIGRPDLADRTVDCPVPPLDPKGRKTDAALDAAWASDVPHLFADLLDTLVGGLARLDAVEALTRAEDLPRFADAALLAEAAAQGLGWTPGLCLAAVNGARRDAAERQLAGDPYAARVRDLLDAEGGNWSGTMTELRDRLLFMDGPEWGRAGNSVQALTTARDRAAASLRDVWAIETRPWRMKGVRRVRLLRVPEN